MIFLDTSVIYALADPKDANHDQALRLIRRAIEASETILLHNYVVLEARGSVPPATRFAAPATSPLPTIHPPTTITNKARLRLSACRVTCRPRRTWAWIAEGTIAFGCHDPI